MGIIEDLFDVFNDIKDKNFLLGKDGVAVINLGQNSISKKANNAILQFPVLVSDTIGIEDLTMVCKALEREYATFIRIAMGLDGVIEKGQTKIDFIKRFHQNAGLKQVERFRLEEDFSVANKEMLKPYSETLNMRNLNDMTVKNNRNHYILAEVDDRSDVVERKIRDKSQYTSQLIPNDVNKANELIPLILDITAFYENEDGDKYQVNILMGIKTIAHLLTSEEMIYNITKSLEEKRAFFRFIQWTSGEISFLRDYVLCLDRIKSEAINKKKNSNWWRSLKLRALSSKIRRAALLKKELLPNATILISMDEVEYIANNYNINLLKDTKTVEQLMDIFFLLGFVIIDSSAELVYFFFNGESNYQTFSFNSLERESKGSGSGDIKALVSLMNRI